MIWILVDEVSEAHGTCNYEYCTEDFDRWQLWLESVTGVDGVGWLHGPL